MLNEDVHEHVESLIILNFEKACDMIYDFEICKNV